MNRKERRAAAKLGGTQNDPRAKTAPPANFAVTQLLAAGLQSHQAGRLAEAEACYRRVLTAQPAYAELHLQLGLALKAQGKLKEAIAAFRRAVAIKPDLAEAHTISPMRSATMASSTRRPRPFTGRSPSSRTGPTLI